VLNDMLSRTLKAYGTELVMSLNHRLDAWVRDVANRAMHDELQRWRKQTCPPLAPPTPPAPPLPPLPEPPRPPSAKSRTLLRWNETDGARSLVQLINSMGGVGGLWDVNKLVRLQTIGALLWHESSRFLHPFGEPCQFVVLVRPRRGNLAGGEESPG
jgi:hypothetical protein